MLTLTSVEAQNSFGKLLDAVQRDPVTITRHGRTAAFMVSPQDMQELQEARHARVGAVEAFEAFFAKSDATLTPAVASLTDKRIAKLARSAR